MAEGSGVFDKERDAGKYSFRLFTRRKKAKNGVIEILFVRKVREKRSILRRVESSSYLYKKPFFELAYTLPIYQR